MSATSARLDRREVALGGTFGAPGLVLVGLTLSMLALDLTASTVIGRVPGTIRRRARVGVALRPETVGSASAMNLCMRQGQELDAALRAVEDSAAQLLVAVRGLRDVLTGKQAPAATGERPGAAPRSQRLPVTRSGPGGAGYDMDR